MADRAEVAPDRPRDSAARAEALLREAIAVLDAGDFDCAAAYAEMACQALVKHVPA